MAEPYPYFVTDVLYIKGRENIGRGISKICYIVIGMNKKGDHEMIGWMIQNGESESSWKKFFNYLKKQGLKGTKLVISDAHKG